VTVHQANLKTMSLKRLPKLGAETAVALVGTAFSAMLLVLMALYAGPLWRDETNTINVAQMPSLTELWNNMPFESFPPLWPLLLRGCGFLGLAGSDASIRDVGLFFLASLWLCSRWMGCRAPILSIGLLGSLPAFIFIVGANRAYGLASGLLVLSFGMVWRMVESPSRSRVLSAGLTCILFAHCVYYDAGFLCAMLTGAALVVIRRRQWKTLGALAGIGTVAVTSMAMYLPIIRRGSAYVPMIQEPFFNFSILWHKLGEALAAQSSARLPQFDGPEIWLWVVLLLGGSVVALMLQRARKHQTQNQEAAATVAARGRADLALFCVVSMVFGIGGYMAFLLRLHFLTQTWYYIEMLCLCAISLDGILGANWPALRPWGWLRIGFMVVVMTWSARSAWEEAHTRRSNVDLIAAVLEKKASKGDLIVVESAWEGITFDRYYRGQVHWVTVPPIDSHKVHRNDLVLERLHQRDPMAPVLREITDTLRGSNSVWVVGNMAIMHPKQPPPPGMPVIWYWSAEVMVHLRGHASKEQILELSVNGPVSAFENLPVVRFSGYKSDAN
jgi:uncharacterized membrane protein YsdA (DUF1294 family)